MLALALAAEVASANTIEAPAYVDLVICRSDRTVSVAGLDVPVVLARHGQVEHALIRWQIYITASMWLAQTPPAPGLDTPAKQFRWGHKSYLQRQICFTSVVGLFACADADTKPLSEDTAGSLGAERERTDAELCQQLPSELDKSSDSLKGDLERKASEIFAADRRTAVDPLFKAANAVIVSPGEFPRQR
jgi:hypothetical protein